jgi:hypothetical protein
MNYTPMKIPCDLTSLTLEAAMGAIHPPIYLHVHPSRVEMAEKIIRDYSGRHTLGVVRQFPTVVSDSTLNEYEWYLVTTIGSNPPS